MLQRKISRRNGSATDAKRQTRPVAPVRKSPLGALPEWNLADLYAGLDDPAVRRDLDRADAESVAFEEAYKGKLDELARGPDAGAALGEAVRLYEALDDLMGGSVPMRGSSMRATPSIQRAPSFTATCRNG